MSASLADVELEVVSLTDTSTLMLGRASLPSSLAVECAMFAKILLLLEVRSKDHVSIRSHKGGRSGMVCVLYRGRRVQLLRGCDMITCIVV
jgi:hypothetical protein